MAEFAESGDAREAGPHFVLPANLPDVGSARLPASYEAAKAALAQCSSIDECADWANKAEALASYAKQAKDDELQRRAERIRARAISRCGELLKQIEPGQGARDGKREEGAHLPLTRTGAARSAGLSEHQQKTAVRVASIPRAQFEAMIEAANPPTITELARQGTVRRPLVDIGERDPEHFALSTQGQGHLRRFAEFCTANDPALIAKGAMPNEAKAIRSHIATIDAWLDRLAVTLEA